MKNENSKEKLEALCKEHRMEINVQEDPFLHVEEFRILSVKRDLDITDEFKS